MAMIGFANPSSTPSGEGIYGPKPGNYQRPGANGAMTGGITDRLLRPKIPNQPVERYNPGPTQSQPQTPSLTENQNSQYTPTQNFNQNDIQGVGYQDNRNLTPPQYQNQIQPQIVPPIQNQQPNSYSGPIAGPGSTTPIQFQNQQQPVFQPNLQNTQMLQGNFIRPPQVSPFQTNNNFTIPMRQFNPYPQLYNPFQQQQNNQYQPFQQRPYSFNPYLNQGGY